MEKINVSAYKNEIIFNPLLNEYFNLEQKFIEETGNKPEFEIILKPSKVTAILTKDNEIVVRGKYEVPITGQARTEIGAKIKSLRNYFKKI